MTIVVVGDLMVDVVAALPGPLAHGSDTPARIAHTHGGSGANVAAWLAAAGAQVAFAGRAGADPLGDAAVAALAGVARRGRARPRAADRHLHRARAPRRRAHDGPRRGRQRRRSSCPSCPAGAHLHLTGYTLLRAGSRAAGCARWRSRASAG